MKAKWPILLNVCAIALFAVPGIAESCDCGQVRVPLPRPFGPKDVVFVGRVVQSAALTYVELDVLETLHGRVDRRVRVPIGRSDCDYFLPPIVANKGAEFLIDGFLADDGALVVNRCSGTGPLKEKAEELKRMRIERRRRGAHRLGYAPGNFDMLVYGAEPR